jgi:HAD superfamily hydrolase (TIGR01509 family)
MTQRAVVSFDLDETLWEFLPMMDGALRATLEALEARRPELRGAIPIEELHRVRGDVAATQEGTFEDLRRESFRQVLEAHGETDPELPAWMVATWMDARLTSVVLHPDVEPALEQLTAAGHVLGAITNGNFPVARLPLASTFAFIVHAEHVGAFKPAAEPFLHAISLAAGDPARWVHVGDDIETDVQGAQSVGMRAVWINRNGVSLPSGVEPDAELPSLDGLAGVVERLLAA